MLLVDRIVERTDNKIVCEKEFRADEFFFQGHYPDFPIVPGVVLCEVAAQSGAILLSGLMQLDNAIPVLSRLNDVKFKRMVRPGETVRIEAQLDEQVGRAFFLSATIKVGEETAVRLKFACSAAPRN